MNTIPEKVHEVLNDYFTLMEARLPDFLQSFYIYGSISLGAFHYGMSDIDFVAVAKRKATNAELNVLKSIHNKIRRRFPKTDLMGLYVMENDLKSQYINQKSCACFRDGSFQGFEKFEKNSIDGYQLKKYGISIKGRRIEEYDYTVNWGVLRYALIDNLNTYWLKWVNDCRHPISFKYIGSLFSLEMIEWGVLGISRLFYSLREGDIISKVGAGEYALQNVPSKWHPIIKEAMRLRKQDKVSSYTSIFKRRKDALEYMDFILQESHALFNLWQGNISLAT